MSDLREALEKLVVLKDGPRDESYQAQKDAAWQAARDALAVPAQVEITDEAADHPLVAAVKAALGEFEGTPCTFWACKGPDVEPEDMVTCSVCRTIRELRAGLTAAAMPYLAPRPLLDRDALGAVLLSFGADVRLDSGRPAEMLGMAVDAVLELVRPMPTRQQIATVLHDGTHGRLQCSGPNCYIWDESYKSADLILSLLGGES